MRPPSPDRFEVAGADHGDLAVVTALLRRCDAAELGQEHTTPQDVLAWWRRPGFDPAADAVLVRTPGGRLVGYGVVDRARESDGYVDPAFTGRGIGDWLLRWLAERAREQRREAGEAGAGALLAWSNHQDTGFRELLERHGYRAQRSQWILRADLDGTPPAAAWPAGVEVRTFEWGRDARAVHRLVQAAFADADGRAARPFQEWAGFMVERDDHDPSLWFLAERAGELLGVALCFDYDTGGWVRQLAVRRDARRQGLGLALLRHAFAEFQRRGQASVGLAVDGDEPAAATRLYLRAGMRVAHRFDRYARRLEPLPAAK
jgi:ribosomal protein S18 acetylase RimI-like enzyme